MYLKTTSKQPTFHVITTNDKTLSKELHIEKTSIFEKGMLVKKTCMNTTFTPLTKTSTVDTSKLTDKSITKVQKEGKIGIRQPSPFKELHIKSYSLKSSTFPDIHAIDKDISQADVTERRDLQPEILSSTIKSMSETPSIQTPIINISTNKQLRTTEPQEISTSYQILKAKADTTIEEQVMSSTSTALQMPLPKMSTIAPDRELLQLTDILETEKIHSTVHKDMKTSLLSTPYPSPIVKKEFTDNNETKVAISQLLDTTTSSVIELDTITTTTQRKISSSSIGMKSDMLSQPESYSGQQSSIKIRSETEKVQSTIPTDIKTSSMNISTTDINLFSDHNQTRRHSQETHMLDLITKTGSPFVVEITKIKSDLSKELKKTVKKKHYLLRKQI